MALLRRKVEERLFGGDLQFFNSVHLNLYRKGSDHVSWHTDADDDLYGPKPIIASVSFGGSRDFAFRSSEKIKFLQLHDGALLVMAGTTQEFWEHSVRPSSEDLPRINMTFRRVLQQQKTKVPCNATASIITGPGGTAYPLARDVALTTTLTLLLPLDLLSFGSLSRSVERLGYVPFDVSYTFNPRSDSSFFTVKSMRESRSRRRPPVFGWFADLLIGGSTSFFSSDNKKKKDRIACAGIFTTRPPQLAVIFCGGNAGDLGYRVPQLELFFDIFQGTADVVTFDYPGFGLSEGVPSERSVYKAVRACLTSYLDRRRSEGTTPPIFLYGHSLGASVALDLAVDKDYQITGLILDGAPASIFNVFDSGSMAGPSTLLSVLDPYPNVKKIPRLHETPVWIVHGVLDGICPPINGRRLYDAAPQSLRRYELPFFVDGAAHGDIPSVAPREFNRRFRSFVIAVLGVPPFYPGVR